MRKSYEPSPQMGLYRASYVESSPDIDLSDRIERFWISGPGAGDGYSLHEILPDGNVDLLISLSDTDCGLHLFGPATRAARIATRCANLYLCMRFQPGQAVRLADAAHADLLDARIELNSLCGMSAEELGQRLLALPGLASRQALLQDLLRRASPKPLVEPLCRKAVRLIVASQGRIKVAELAHTLGMGIRRLERIFAAGLGMPPKPFMRLVRLQRAVQGLRALKPDYADLALACGFSDQAHMIREFRDLAGRTPSAAAQGLSHTSLPAEPPEAAPEHVVG